MPKALAEVDASLAALTTAVGAGTQDGNSVPLRVDSQGALWVRETNTTLSATNITADSNHAGVTRFAGFSIREAAATAAAATVRIREQSDSGQILAVIELAQNESATLVLDDHFDTSNGTYVQVVSGTIEGVLYQRSE